MPRPPCAAADGEEAHSTGPQPAGKGKQGQALGGGSGREQNGLSPSGGKARRGAGACWGLGLQGRQTLPSTGRVQAEPGQRRHQQCPTAPASSAHSPAQGQNMRGPGAARRAGSVRGGPCPFCGLSLGHKGRRCPAPCSPVQGGSWPHCRQPQPWWDGQAAGKQAAEAEAWPLLLLKGMGVGRQALRRWRGASTQRAEPGMQAEAQQVLRAAGAGGCRAMGWDQSRPCPGQPSLSNDNPGTPHAAHPGGLV